MQWVGKVSLVLVLFLSATLHVNCANVLRSEDLKEPNSLLPSKGDPCLSNPCKNDGTCDADGTGFKCKCRAPWKGESCEE
ncbi:hypothetical protein AVEN_31019-1, partial [Araneus ventricosus]